MLLIEEVLLPVDLVLVQEVAAVIAMAVAQVSGVSRHICMSPAKRERESI